LKLDTFGVAILKKGSIEYKMMFNSQSIDLKSQHFHNRMVIDLRKNKHKPTSA